jgi:HD-like signal output (HDOD) protein/DNA-binding NarL/FixJ family response regulator
MAKAKVLFVDDMALLRELIAGALSAAGYTVRVAGNAREALELVRAEAPDLVVLEPSTCGGDGLRFLKALRLNPQHAGLPVIVLTSVADRKLVMATARLKVHDYILKCRASVKNLVERIERCARGEAKPLGTPAEPAGVEVKGVSKGAVVTPAAAARVEGRTAGTVSKVGRDGAPAVSRVLLTREKCLERAEKALQAKTLSGVVAQVIAQAASPRSDMGQLAELISRDVVLSAKVLQAANSAAYVSSRGMITSIPEAVRHIGCSTIRNVAAAVGVFEAMPETGADGFNPIRCWQHSFAVARLCAQLVSVEKPDEAGTAYLAGLCHDLGEILFRTHFGPEYAEVLEVYAASGTPLRQLEREMLGMTQGELSKTILRCLSLPQVIRDPIEAAHADGEARQPLARILRLADGYANGLLLAAGEGAPVAPLSRSDCRKATGEECPAQADGDPFRAEILSRTSMLARLDNGDARRLTEPLYPRGEATVWLAREGGLSAFDPVAAALGSLGSVRVSDRLPHPDEAAECDGLVVLARSALAAGLDGPAVSRAAALPGRSGEPIATLWLAGARLPEESGRAPSAVKPRTWPIEIGELAEFVAGCVGRDVTARAA